MEPCLFCRISQKEIPSMIVYEDDFVIAFLDIKPVNPGHVLVAPKAHFDGLHDVNEQTLCRLAVVVQKLAKSLTNAVRADGCNIEQNNGAAAGQVIPHLHIHVIPRFVGDGFMHWPGTPYPEGEMERVAGAIRSAIHT